MKHLTIAVLVGLSSGAIAGTSVFTDFEDITPNTPIGGSFDVATATFSGVGNFAGVVGEGELYHSGIRAWMVQGEGIGRVDFAGGASLVEFWGIVDPKASANASISAFTADDVQIGTSASIVVGDEFTFYNFTGDISYILFDHSGALNEPTGMISIDDFGFNPVPASGTVSAFAAVCLFGARRRRKG
jgi:hypothetical protein